MKKASECMCENACILMYVPEIIIIIIVKLINGLVCKRVEGVREWTRQVVKRGVVVFSRTNEITTVTTNVEGSHRP